MFLATRSEDKLKIFPKEFVHGYFTPVWSVAIVFEFSRVYFGAALVRHRAATAATAIK